MCVVLHVCPRYSEVNLGHEIKNVRTVSLLASTIPVNYVHCTVVYKWRLDNSNHNYTESDVKVQFEKRTITFTSPAELKSLPVLWML